MIDKFSSNTFSAVLNELRKRLKESSPAYIQIVSGPRQIGKTTLLMKLAKEWGKRAVYVAADSPEASMPGWWDVLWVEAEQRAMTGVCLLLIDEIQYLPSWGRMLKVKYDEMKRRRIQIRVVATGSSSLRLGAGARESMAGRFIFPTRVGMIRA